MNRIIVFKIALVIVVTYVLTITATAADKKTSNSKTSTPNVVFIICDDLNDALGSMGGHPQALTPNLDKLASNGVAFSNTHTNAPICGPSRASLWSGLYPHTTGYYGYNQQANHWRNNPTLKESVTLFEHLSANGYQVYATGKIHHNGHEDMTIFNNSDGKSGFDIYPSFGPYPWDGNQSTNNVKERGVMHPYMPAEFQNLGCWESFGPVTNLSQTMNGKGTWLYNHDAHEYKYVDENNRDLMPDEKCVDFTKQVLNRKHDKPFFMTVGFNRPHTPLYVPQKYFDMFSLDTLVLAPYLKNDLADCADALRNGDFNASGYYKYKNLVNSSDKALMLKWTQAYLACVAFVDEQIGNVVKAVENSEYADNTLIIVTSDHGYHMGEKEYLFKNTLWEESTRIPLIVSGLNTPKNKVCTKPVSLIDMYPTIVDYCGLPENPNSQTNDFPLDGNSIKPLVSNPEDGNWEGRDFALTAIASNYELKVNEPGLAFLQHFSLRTEQYRYTLCRNGDEELYDHHTDEYEWTNVAGNPDNAEIKKELKSKLQEATKPSPDQVMIFEPIRDYKPDDLPFEISALVSSGLDVTFMIESGPATISGNVITLSGETGTVKVVASQAGDDYFNPVSKVQSFEVKSLVNILLNGDFEDGTAHWTNLANNGALATYTSSTEGSAQGEKYLKVQVESTGNNHWDAQSISTAFDVNQQHNYKVSFMAKANSSLKLRLVVQQGKYIANDYTLSREWKPYSFEFKPKENTKSVRFNYLNVGTYYLDNIEVFDLDAVVNSTIDLKNLANTDETIYPNPFSNTLSFNKALLPTAVKIYDTLGKMVYREGNANGISTITGLDSFKKGIYYLNIIAHNEQKVIKVIKN